MMFCCLLPATFLAQGTTYPPLTVGSQAPDFSLPFATKDSVGFGEISLSSYKGNNVILAFYPADWSGGCTREVCTLRDNFTALSELKATILAVSGDYPYSHHEWAKFHSLPFLLLSDHRNRVAPLYHSFNESTGYNKRTVYLIDSRGMIAYVDLEYSTRDMTSFDKLKAALSRLTNDSKN
jgi:glutaredoxin-dependent peroxiredoxin